MPSPDREILSQAAAREVLARVGELELDSVRVDQLRVAAREGGFSEEAFEAALAEVLARKGETTPPPPRRRRRLVGVVVTATLLALMAMVFARRAVPPSTQAGQAGLVPFDVAVRCISLNEAMAIAQTVLTGPEHNISAHTSSGTLHFSSSHEQMVRVQALIDQRIAQTPSCSRPSESGPPRGTPP